MLDFDDVLYFDAKRPRSIILTMKMDNEDNTINDFAHRNEGKIVLLSTCDKSRETAFQDYVRGYFNRVDKTKYSLEDFRNAYEKIKFVSLSWHTKVIIDGSIATSHLVSAFVDIFVSTTQIDVRKWTMDQQKEIVDVVRKHLEHFDSIVDPSFDDFFSLFFPYEFSIDYNSESIAFLNLFNYTNHKITKNIKENYHFVHRLADFSIFCEENKTIMRDWKEENRFTDFSFQDLSRDYKKTRRSFFTHSKFKDFPLKHKKFRDYLETKNIEEIQALLSSEVFNRSMTCNIAIFIAESFLSSYKTNRILKKKDWVLQYKEFYDLLFTKYMNSDFHPTYYDSHNALSELIAIYKDAHIKKESFFVIKYLKEFLRTNTEKDYDTWIREVRYVLSKKWIVANDNLADVAFCSLYDQMEFSKIKELFSFLSTRRQGINLGNWAELCNNIDSYKDLPVDWMMIMLEGNKK